MYTLRPFAATDDDFNLQTGIWNAGHPDEQTTADLQRYYYGIRNTDYLYHLDFIEHNGTVIAYGSYNQNPSYVKAKKCFLVIAVRPDVADQQDVRQFYLKAVSERLTQTTDIATLVMWSREDYSDDLHFFQQNGFKQVFRAPTSALDVSTFDPAPFTHRIDKLQADGVEFLTATQLQTEAPDTWGQQLYDLEVAIGEDIPRVEAEYVPRSFEEYVDFRLKNINFLPEAYFIARENGVCVGESILKKNLADPTTLFTASTGTLRSHRRRGIATALKVKAIEYAQSIGIKTIKTDNEENNPMYQINMQLGFTPQPAYLDFEKSLT